MPLLEAEGLEKRFGGVRALSGFSLTLEEGGLLCLIGPNGCGKTTFFRVLSGEAALDAGRIRFAGEAIDGLTPTQITRRGIARKLQTPGLFPALSVAQHLALARSSPAAAGEFDAGATLEALDLAALAGRPASELAHGQRQWLEIAMLMALGPRLLLLDEPTAGMSVGETRRAAALVRRLNRETGVAVIVIEHDLAFVRELEAPVMVMMQGRAVRSGSYEEIRADPMVRELYLGRRA